MLSEKYDDELPLLSAEERLVKQNMINLIVNAIKFTGQGGRITVSANADEKGRISIAVSDTGVGIAPDELERVTELFFKSKPDSLLTADGTGLGLSIAQEWHCMLAGLSLKAR